MMMVTFPMYVHIKTGNLYYKLNPAKMKFDGVWYDGVAYKSADSYHSNEPDQIFFRTKENWEESFTLQK
jgi:hypothetical protein